MKRYNNYLVLNTENNKNGAYSLIGKTLCETGRKLAGLHMIELFNGNERIYFDENDIELVK